MRCLACCRRVLLAGGVVVLLPACPKDKPNAAPVEVAPRALPLVVSRCGPGLAAEDLAGRCRVRDCPTPGALEAETVPDAAMPPCPPKAKSSAAGAAKKPAPPKP